MRGRKGFMEKIMSVQKYIKNICEILNCLLQGYYINSLVFINARLPLPIHSLVAYTGKHPSYYRFPYRGTNDFEIVPLFLLSFLRPSPKYCLYK